MINADTNLTWGLKESESNRCPSWRPGVAGRHGEQHLSWDDASGLPPRVTGVVISHEAGGCVTSVFLAPCSLDFPLGSRAGKQKQKQKFCWNFVWTYGLVYFLCKSVVIFFWGGRDCSVRHHLFVQWGRHNTGLLIRSLAFLNKPFPSSTNFVVSLCFCWTVSVHWLIFLGRKLGHSVCSCP